MTTRLKFAARLIVWLVIAGVTLEVCARVEDSIRYGAAFFGNYSLDSLYEFDAIGKYGKPNSSYLKWHLNEVGYRGPALRQGTYRIACIGSSETFGLYEAEEKEWPRQLEALLDQRLHTNGYEVVDVAYPGLSIGTTLKRLSRMLDAVSPKLVVVYPSYASYIETSKPQEWPVPPPTTQALRVPHRELRMAGRFHTFSKDVLPTAIQDWMRAYTVRHDPEAQHAMPTLPQQNVDAFHADLARLVDELTKKGIRVVLVTHATRFGREVKPEDAPYLTSWRTSYPTIEEAGLLDMEKRMSAVVKQVAADTSTPVVDGAELVPAGKENFAEFVHFTTAGAKVLATIVADEIAREVAAGRLPAPPVIERGDAKSPR